MYKTVISLYVHLTSYIFIIKTILPGDILLMNIIIFKKKRMDLLYSKLFSNKTLLSKIKCFNF